MWSPPTTPVFNTFLTRANRWQQPHELFAAAERVAAGSLEVDSMLWRAIIKTTGDRSETHLQSVHRVEPSRLVRARRTLGSLVGKPVPCGPRIPSSPEGM